MLFIKNELIPEMVNEYGADTLRKNRTILGHSFGGLFGAYAFTNYNKVFGNYILLSPSLWYADEIVFKFEQDNRNVVPRMEERHDGRQGYTLLINGKENPRIDIHAGQTERWRFINSSSARYFVLSLGGREFKIIGTDGGC